MLDLRIQQLAASIGPFNIHSYSRCITRTMLGQVSSSWACSIVSPPQAKTLGTVASIEGLSIDLGVCASLSNTPVCNCWHLWHMPLQSR